VAGEQEGVPDGDAAARAAAIVSEGIEAWAALVGRWSERARAGDAWTADGVREEVATFVEAMRPPAEAAAELVAELARPWAEAFQARRGGTPP
jgi:hypothetical protein